jgi:hypothetical protein
MRRLASLSLSVRQCACNSRKVERIFGKFDIGYLGRPRRKREDNIKMDLREIGFGDVDSIHWAQDRDRWRALVNTVMNLRVP